MIVLNENMLNVTSGILMHGVNCQGVMGSGIAAQIRSKWPVVFTDYEAYISKMMRERGWFPDDFLGEVVLSEVSESLVIASAFTQESFGRDKNRVYVSYYAIERVFMEAAEIAQELGLPLCFPKIGAGLANGSWEKISEIISKVEGMVDVEFRLYDWQP